MNEKRFWNYKIGTQPAFFSFLKVTLHLANQQVALRFFQLIKHYNAHLFQRTVFQKIIEPLKKVNIIFSEQLILGQLFVVVFDNGTKHSASKTQTDFEQFRRKSNFGLCKRSNLLKRSRFRR